MRVSVYIPCYNGRTHLDHVLGALAGQTRAPDEILMVDDGSTDGSAEQAARAGARTIVHERNRGIAAARNTALKGCTGDVLIGLDTDAVPAPDYVERATQAFERDADLAALCGRLVEAHSVLLPDRWRQVHMAQHHGDAPRQNPRICFGSVTSVRRDVVERLGGWNEKYRTNHEDVDLSERMRAAGVRSAYDPACLARHRRRDTLAGVLSGFWNWFAPRGRDEGHFQSLDSLAGRRVGPVNWGICGHRMNSDVASGQAHLAGPTFLLPWWMALHDLAETGGGATTARALVDRFGDLVWTCGAGEYIVEQGVRRLSQLHTALFGAESVKSASAHEGYLDEFAAQARQHLPHDRFEWGRVEFSLRRLELEEALQRCWKNDYRVMLANPPWYTDKRQGVRAGSRWSFTMDRRDQRPIPRYVPFPFFLAQAAQVLNDDSQPNAVVDAIAEGLTYDVFHERVNGYAPSLVVMETSAASFDNDREIWRRLRRELPKARLVLAGPHATARRKEILEHVPEIEAVLIGEYEATLSDVVRRWADGQNAGSIKGLAFRQNGRVVDTGRPEPVPFDRVGCADRLRLPMYNYRDAFGGLREPMAQLMATRGCPYECNFCQWPQVFYERRTIQRRSAANVFNEVRELVTRYGFPAVYFDDDMFSPGQAWLVRFLEMIRRSGLVFEWGIMSRADTFSAEQYRAMADAGLRAVKFGVESGDQDMIDAMGKRLRLDTLRDTMHVCRGLGIRVHLTFTVGLPGESHETLARTRELILELMPDSLQISRAMPLPGTALEDWAVRNGAMKTPDVSARDGFLQSVLQYPALDGAAMDRFIESTYAEYSRKRGATQCPESKATSPRAADILAAART